MCRDTWSRLGKEMFQLSRIDEDSRTEISVGMRGNASKGNIRKSNWKANGMILQLT
jgi:hypothetical protein